MKFRKKPVVIEAEQWMPNGQPFDVEQAQRLGVTCYYMGEPAHLSCCINTLEGTMTVSPGDWIIIGVKGERYPCKPDIFAATYEFADGPSDTERLDWLERHASECEIAGKQVKARHYGLVTELDLRNAIDAGIAAGLATS